MSSFFERISVRLRLFVPLLAGIVLAVALATVFLTRLSIKTLDYEMEQSLSTEVNTIIKMFEREHQLKLDQVRTNLKVLHELFYQKTFNPAAQPVNWTISNQLNSKSHTVELPGWIHDRKSLHGSTAFVDMAQSLFGGTVTIFQLADSGFVRISTNVLQSDSSRALQTYIPLSSPVSRSVLDGNTYYGRAYVINDWYITAYEPIFHEEKVIGMLYVGNKEKDLEVLRENIAGLRIGKSGFTFVFDREGMAIMHPEKQVEDLSDDLLFFKKNEIDMIGMGPYVEEPGSPMHRYKHLLWTAGDRFLMTRKMVAVLRIMMPEINIAATTASEALVPNSRETLISTGANVIMPNITPPKYQGNCALYTNKPDTYFNRNGEFDSFTSRIEGLGYSLAPQECGDSMHYLKKQELFPV
jgi:hypothetical protein